MAHYFLNNHLLWQKLIASLDHGKCVSTTQLNCALLIPLLLGLIPIEGKITVVK